jgi:hypothetical protein
LEFPWILKFGFWFFPSLLSLLVAACPALTVMQTLIPPQTPLLQIGLQTR